MPGFSDGCVWAGAERGPPREQRLETTAGAECRGVWAWGAVGCWPGCDTSPGLPGAALCAVIWRGKKYFSLQYCYRSLSLWAALDGTASTSLGHPGIQMHPRAFLFKKIDAVVVQEALICVLYINTEFLTPEGSSQLLLFLPSIKAAFDSSRARVYFAALHLFSFRD